SQASLPSSRCTRRGASSRHRSARWDSNMSGGSTTWSSTLTRIRSSMRMTQWSRVLGRFSSMTLTARPLDDTSAGTFTLGHKTVRRLGFGAMRITGDGIWGEPPDHDEAVRVVRRAVDLGVNLIDTADSYGPEISENIIAEALHPYPDDLLIATKGGLV